MINKYEALGRLLAGFKVFSEYDDVFIATKDPRNSASLIILNYTTGTAYEVTEFINEFVADEPFYYV
jgi:hypothetical protein